MDPSLPPLSLYVHLPWCIRKCPYCDFNSYEARGGFPEADYVAALLRDLRAESELTAGRPYSTIFIGGGTPSLFSGAAIARLLDGIRAGAPLADDVEITLEANPGAVEAERFAEYRAAGVSRLSIGAQSFRDPQLARLGRVHAAADAVRAVESARQAGFDNFNLDLMYGLPGDDVAGALADLESAMALRPAHLSWYQLTLEPDTAFYRRPPALPDDDVVAAIEEGGRALLAAAGFRRYEVSAYAQPGRRCAHNVNYWQFGDYVGIGAGAHGKLTSAHDGAIVRRSKLRNPRSYLDHAGTVAATATVERVTDPQQRVVEFMMNALRLTDGVAAACFEERTGQTLGSIAPTLAQAVRRGWMSPDRGVLRATPAGLTMLNALLALFVTDPVDAACVR